MNFIKRFFTETYVITIFEKGKFTWLVKGWQKRKKKYSYQEKNELRESFIQQQYGGYTYGDEVLEDGKKLIFLEINNSMALLFDKDKGKTQYISVNMDKLIDSIHNGTIKVN